MSLQFKHLLASDAQLPPRIRHAIAAGALREAGHMLMADFGLDCTEVSLLLDAPLCSRPSCAAQ